MNGTFGKVSLVSQLIGHYIKLEKFQYDGAFFQKQISRINLKNHQSLKIEIVL